ncbi:Asp-domain-containing protein [Obba rivulosa]|uniref:Asp-domain-containing protein n=1 Tax=Obba rivulosa TaxID=1052685 RepID=A0A8E2J2X5_9APHY|nr:Asp-domain-containing protein [Obba rivulosa]
MSRSSLAGRITIPIAKRSHIESQDSMVNARYLTSHIRRVGQKIRRGLKRLQSSGAPSIPLSTSAKCSLSRKPRGTQELDEEEDVLWQGIISVGTPPVQYTVDLDTGSSDLILPGIDCDENCQGHNLYDPSKSSTSEDSDKTFGVAFGDGSTVDGVQMIDTVAIAGLTVTSQALGVATQYSAGFSPSAFSPDGLLGMAFPQISALDAEPLFQTLVSENQTVEPIFAFKLGSSGSQLTLGGVDESQFQGPMTQVPVTTVGFWQVDLDAVSVNGHAAVTASSAIFDTGTTLILGSSHDVGQLYAAIPGAADASATMGSGFFTLPCNQTPDVTFTFGGAEFPLSADTFNLGKVSPGSSTCVGGIVASDIDSRCFWILGDVFLQNVYASFNVGNLSVGLAALA